MALSVSVYLPRSYGLVAKFQGSNSPRTASQNTQASVFGAVRSYVAFEKELVRTIEMREVDLAEEKSGRIVGNKMRCL